MSDLVVFGGLAALAVLLVVWIGWDAARDPWVRGREARRMAPNGELHIRELRRGVQQMFMGFASALPGDPQHRIAARDLTHAAWVELDLRVIGEQGEAVGDVEGAIRQALDDQMDFSLDVPEDV